MNKNPIQTLKGFRDFLPSEKHYRDLVMTQLKNTFELFGFLPLETPTLEYTSLLLGKYGEEADQLVYTFEDKGGRQVGLRYDQTVPTARVLTQYQHLLPKYFRRYQIQNVFRADKPQKGRFREFTQCDIDIFNISSPIADAEIIACVYRVFKNIGFHNVQIKINDRQSLVSTLTPFTSETVNISSLIQSIDKLDKNSSEEVIVELVGKGLNRTVAQQALDSLQLQTPSTELSSIMTICQQLGVDKADLIFSPTLARGLDYYTGMIFEVIIPEYLVGSCGGGGRYDQLIAQLGGPSIAAVGAGIGFDRVVEAAKQLHLLQAPQAKYKILACNIDHASQSIIFDLTSQLRLSGISVEIYPSQDSLSKQLSYASKNNFSHCFIVGDEEMNTHEVVVKNLKTKTQQKIPITALATYLTKET